jgi:Fibronectin type III domain
MRKAERVGRFVGLTLLGSMAIALAGCGNNDSGVSNAGASSAGTTGSTTPATVADTAPTSGSATSATAPPSTPTSSSVAFSWVPPTENSNGTPITNLAGYKIHYGTASQDYTEVVAVSNPSLSRYVLDNLANGTYYFAITAYNSQGIESTLSGEISATVN